MHLIVGATGSLGGAVAKSLLARGERVRAVARAESPLRATGRFTDPAELRALGADVVEADLRNPDTLEPLMRGVDTVLSTASGTKRMEPDTLDAVDHRGTAALARVAKRAGVSHLVYVSARGTGPDANPFLRPKWEAENAIREHGPAATFIRPGQFMQDWIGFVLGAQIQGGSRVQVIGEGDPARAYVDEADVAKLLTAVMLDGPPQAGTATRQIDFTADTATVSDVVGRIAALTGLPLTVERIPVGRSIDTVPEPLASILTQLLTITSTIAHDTLVTTDVSERYGIEPRTIDVFLQDLFARTPA